MTTVWIIEPHDPFIARDGRPFGIGMRASTLPFPFPSTLAGGVRTRAGLNINGVFDVNLTNEVKNISVRGPLLVALDDNEIETWFMPAPADALLFEDQTNVDQILAKQLVPVEIADGVTNLDHSPHDGDKLLPIGFPKPDQRKPAAIAPRFWRWDKFRMWLLDAESLTRNPITLEQLGHEGATKEARTHVAVNPETLTALESQLFETQGLEFIQCEEGKLGGARRLAMAVAVEEDAAKLSGQINAGLAPLGGERRIVAWSTSDKPFPEDCLADIQDQIAKDKACRLILLTPAYFANGSSPMWLRQKQYNIDVELKALAMGRAQVVSGWDFERGRPKPTRRLAAAGSVFFLKLNGNDKDIKTWVKEIWMHCVSDDDFHRNDGFGLAVLGIWDGKPQKMNTE